MQQYAVEGLKSCLQANNFYDTHGSTHPTVFCSLLWRKNELVAVYRKNYSSYAYSFRILCARGDDHLWMTLEQVEISYGPKTKLTLVKR